MHAPHTEVSPGQATGGPGALSDAELDELPAATLLQIAFEQLRQGFNQHAAEAFNAAINTGNLNEAGRAWAYWHLYVTQRDEGRLDASADALASFVVVGQDLIDQRHAARYAVDEESDFVERFDLARRVSLARAMLSVIWAQRVPPFGRSEERPIPVHTSREIDYFLELAAPCGNQEAREVFASPTNADATANENPTHRITVSCPESRAQVYFFAPNFNKP